MKKTVYIAGRVSDEDYNAAFEKFAITEEILQTANFETINPMRIVPKGTTWGASMDILKPHLLSSDYLLLLPDWQDSDGAFIEHRWAIKNNIQVVHYGNIHADLFERV